MTEDVLVKHCELTVRGRGGWGWGPDPRRHLDAALPAIEQALHRIVAEADLPEGADVHLDRPMRLRWRRDHTLDDEARHELVAALRAAVQERSESTAAEPAGDDRPDEVVRLSEHGSVQPVPSAAGELARLLGAWSRTGRLPRLVAAWPEATVRRWTAQVTAADGGADLPEEAVRAVATAVQDQSSRPGEPALDSAHRALVVIGALVAAAGDRPVGVDTADAVARLLGDEHDDQTGFVTRSEGAGSPSPAGRPLVRTGREPPGPLTATTRRTAAADRPIVVPGLPFLVLVQLARLGYLDVVAAVAATTPDPDAASRVLIGGLAGKVLPPPGRGWSRAPAELAALERAAGRPGSAQDEAAHALGRQTATVVPPLRAALVHLYTEVGAADLEITGTAHGWVVGERQGSLPVAWVSDRTEVDRVLSQLGDPPAAASPRFDPLVTALHARRGFAGVELPSLERLVGAAVGTALGSLALELWGQVDDAPLLALSRLGDLEVEARPALDRDGPGLTLAVPRGQRWLDLTRAGLLDRWSIPGTAGGWELVTW